MVFHNGTKNTQWGKTSPQEKILTKPNIHMQNKDNSYLIQKLTKNQDIKCKNIKLLEEN